MSPDAAGKLISAEVAIGMNATTALSNVINAQHLIDCVPDRARKRVADARAGLQTAIDAIDDAIAAMDGAPPERVVEPTSLLGIAAPTIRRLIAAE